MTTATSGCVGVVTGLAREAACLDAVARGHERGKNSGDALRVLCLGMGPRAAAEAAAELLAAGCSALASFGTAGGLAPELTAGDVVIASIVVTPGGGSWAVAESWQTCLVTALQQALQPGISVVTGPLAGVDAPVVSAAEKEALNNRTGALAVDMESHAVAEVAATRAVPFVAIRAVLDPAGQAVPAWLGQVVDARGEPRIGPLLRGLLAHPGDTGALLRLGRDQAKAMASLRRVAGHAGTQLLLR